MMILQARSMGIGEGDGEREREREGGREKTITGYVEDDGQHQARPSSARKSDCDATLVHYQLALLK